MTEQEETKKTEEKPEQSLVWIVIKHPITIAIIGIIATVMVYILTREVKEPVFTVSSPELVAQTVDGEQKLKIFWNKRAIPNAASVKIAIWNDGSRFIDKNDFISSDPLRIIPSAKVNILAVQVLKTSRPSLKFDINIGKNAEETECVMIDIKGDEALEKFDGGLFHILFSGSRDSNWKVLGRVKGAKEGFQEVSWGRLHRIQYPPRLWVLIILPLAALGFTIYSTFLTLRNIKKEGKKIGWPGLVLGNLVVWGILIMPVILECQYLSVPLWLIR
jgi:hypothetical protein